MITFSIIQKSQLEGAHRLDAEYYQPEYLNYSSSLEKFPLVRLSEVCLVTDGNHSTISEKFTDSGVRYLRGKDLQDFFISDSDPIYIPENIYEKLKRSHIFQDDVLVSIVGTIGLVGIVADRFDRLTGNCKIAILHPKSINSWFLSGFLASRYGRYQLERMTGGAVQTGVILKDLVTLQIPRMSDCEQDHIVEVIKRAYDEQLDSEKLYQQAEYLLLEELRLKDFQIEEDLSFIVNLSDVKSADRIDAEYFQPKYQKLVEQIKKHNAKLLGDLVSMKKGFEPGSEAYQEEGKLFIRVSSLSKFGIEEKDQKYLSEDLYKNLQNDFEPKLGEILLTKDATPGIAYVVKEPIEGIISGGILRLKTKNDADSEYLALCINSIIGQWQAERDAGGSVIAHWKPEQIKNILIPILPKPTQQKIAELVRKSHEARKKSKELLEEAKGKVEEMIENKTS